MVLLNYPEAFIFAMLSTMAFGIIFQAPRRSLPLCGAVGAVGWLVYIYLRNGAELDSFYANLAAALAAMVLVDSNKEVVGATGHISTRPVPR